MAHAVRVHRDERWVIHQAPAGLALAVIHRDADDDPAMHAPVVSADRRFWLWMAGEAYDGGTLCHVPSVAASRTPAFRRTLLDALLAHGLDALASLDGRYQIVLRVNDPAVRTRRLDVFFYTREVEIDQV